MSRDIRTVLADAAASVDDEPDVGAMRRRARLRQRLTSGIGLAVALAAVLVGLQAWPTSRDVQFGSAGRGGEEGLDPATPAEGLDPEAPAEKPRAHGAPVPECLPQHSAQIDGPLSADPAVAEAQRERARLGLPSDVETVSAVLAGERGPIVDWFGFPVLERELAELERRAGQRGGGVDAGEEVGRYLGTDPGAAAAFGGMWVDATRAEFVVAFTGDQATHEEALRARMPGVRLRVDQVRYSQRELLATRDAVPLDLDLEGPRITGKGVDPQANRVVVLLDEVTEEARLRLGALPQAAQLCVERREPAVPAGR